MPGVIRVGDAHGMTDHKTKSRCFCHVYIVIVYHRLILQSLDVDEEEMLDEVFFRPLACCCGTACDATSGLLLWRYL